MRTYGLGSVENQVNLYDSLVENGLNKIVDLKKYINQPEYEKPAKMYTLADVERITSIPRNTIREKEKTGQLRYTSAEVINNSVELKKEYSLQDIKLIRKLFNKGFFNGAVDRPSNLDPIILSMGMFKGGVGKTVHATHLAAHLAINGLNVLLGDLDPQASATFMFGYIPGIDINADKSILTALTENPEDIKNVIRPTHYHGLDIITSGLELQAADISLPNFNLNNAATLGSPLLRLKKALRLVPQYDVIILDCAPNHAATTMNALTASDAIIIPITPSMVAYGSSVHFLHTLGELAHSLMSFKTNDKVSSAEKELVESCHNKLFRVLITNDAGDNESRDVSAAIKSLYGDLVLPRPMINTIALSRASNDIGLLYDLKRSDVRGSKESFDRGLFCMKEVNDDILKLIASIWGVSYV
ncbi:MAG: AAA family ATPase [Gammaproteobacteria bacterium]